MSSVAASLVAPLVSLEAAALQTLLEGLLDSKPLTTAIMLRVQSAATLRYRMRTRRRKLPNGFSMVVPNSTEQRLQGSSKYEACGGV